MSETLPQEWADKADEDYWSALALVRQRRHPVPGMVCFHCHQCAEKYLKAFLTHQGIAFPRTHDLIALNKLCANANTGFQQIADWLDNLNTYAVEVRYPGESITLAEARSAIQSMKSIRQFVRARLQSGLLL